MFMCTAEAPRHAGAGFGDRPHHDRGLGDAEAGAAILLAECKCRASRRRRMRAMEIVREAALAISFRASTSSSKRRADGQDRIADRLLFGAEGEIHQTRSEFAGAAAAACGPWTTPFVNKSSIDCSASPSSCRISRLCSPSVGAGLGLPVLLSLHVLGVRIDLILPSVGCSTCVKKPMAPRCGSATRSLDGAKRRIGDVGLLEECASTPRSCA